MPGHLSLHFRFLIFDSGLVVLEVASGLLTQRRVCVCVCVLLSYLCVHNCLLAKKRPREKLDSTAGALKKASKEETKSRRSEH